VGVGAAAILLSAAPGPSLAEIQTVPADQVTSLAKPLKVQKVNKERIWLLLILGASSLFGITVLLENNEQWFPAISRANRAMATSKKMSEQQLANSAIEQAEFEDRLQEVVKERNEDARLESAVLAGLQDAKAQLGIGPGSGVVAQAEVEDIAQIEHQYPLQLDVGEEGEGEEYREDGYISEQGAAETSSTSDGGNAADQTKKPLFEISGDQIEASMRSVQNTALSEMSLEDLQKELERRKAASGSG